MDTVDTVLTGCSSGRPEIFDDEDGDGNGKWRGICDDGWGSEEAEAVCRQLGFSGNTPHGSTTPSLTITKPTAFLLDEVVCDGDEDKLLDCDHAGRGVSDCQGTEHAGVGCS